MISEDYLFESGGLLSMGEQAERIFGRKNFLELYAVFSSPVLYRVSDRAGREIGSLEQDFVDSLVEDMSSLPARRAGLDRRARQPRRAHRARPRGAARQEAELGRLRPADSSASSSASGCGSS